MINERPYLRARKANALPISRSSLSALCAQCAAARSVAPSTALLIWIAAVGVVTGASITAWRARSRTPRRIALAVVLMVSVLGAATWLFVNGSVEIQPIVSFTHRHGITAADLAALPFGATALWAVISLREAFVADRRRR